MYRRIIVPLDGSELSESVFPHVLELARRFEAEVLLLRSVTHLQELMRETVTAEQPQLGLDVARARLESEQASAERDLAASRDRLQAEGATRVSTRVAEGPAAAAILEAAADDPGRSLIVMATHGRGGLRRLALGSVADRVVQELQGVPLLLYRPE